MMHIKGAEESCNCCYPMYRLKAKALRGEDKKKCLRTTRRDRGFRRELKRSSPEKNLESAERGDEQNQMMAKLQARLKAGNEY